MLSDFLNFRSRVGGGFLSLALCAFSAPLCAQTPTDNIWTGTISSDWNEPGNWTLGHVPADTERARITGGTVSAGSIYCAELAVDAGTLALVGNNHASATTIATGATFTIAGTDEHTLAGSLTNHGTILWNGGDIALLDRITNASDGVIEIRCDQLLQSSVAFENRGVIRKTVGGAGAQAALFAPLNSSGSILVEIGTLYITEPAAFSGLARVASGAQLNVTAYNGAQLAPTARFEGAGAIAFKGDYSGTFTGKVTYQGGRATDLTITHGSTFTLDGFLAISGTVTNHGTVVIQNGSIAGYDLTGTLLNAADGLIDLRCDTRLTDFVFTNAGTLRKSAGTIEGQALVLAHLNSSGTIIVETGGLAITEAETFSGAVQVAAGARFNATAYNVTTQITPQAHFDGDGEIVFLGNSAGTFTGKATLWREHRGDLTIAPGSTVSIGTPRDIDFTLAGTISNHGTVLWTGGNINLESESSVTGTIVNEANGIFDIRYGAHLGPNLTFDNRGTIIKAAASGNIGTTSTCALTSTGSILIESGGIDLTGSVTYAGLVHVDAGARLNTSAWSVPVTLAASARFEGDGSVSFAGKVNGTLSGNAELALELSGDLMIAPGSNVAIGRAFSGQFRLNGTLTNHGTLRWIENSDSSLPPGSMGRNTIAGGSTTSLANRIINETDGLFDLQCGGQLEATVSLDNHGTLRKTGGLAPADGTWIAGAFTNDGTVDIPVSLLSISNPSSNSGLITVAAGATLQYEGATTGTPLLPGSAFQGPGRIRLSGKISGTLVGNALLSSQLSGDLTVASGSTVTIGDGDDRDFTLASSLTNHGTVLWRGGRIRGDLGNPACAIINSVSGVFDIQCNDSIDSAISFTNQGTLRKTSEASTTTLDCAFTNSGTIEASTGELVFGQTFVQPKGAIQLAGGKLTKAAPYDLRLDGGELSGHGTIGGNLVANSATIRPGSAGGSPLVVEGGLRIKSPGALAISYPGTVLQTGFLGVDAGATFAVQVSAAPSVAPVKLTGFAFLNGNLNLSLGNGFIPSLGSHLRLIDCASLSGTFAASSFPSQPTGASYSVAYGTNLVEVVVAGSTYEDWKALHFGAATDPAIVGDTSDPDRDGIANLLEYAFGLEPLSASRTGLPVVALQSATAGGPLFLTLTYTTPATVTDLAIVPEVSSNLSDWQSGPGQTVTVSDTISGGIRTVVVRDTVPTATGTRRFIRLSVQSRTTP